MAATRRTLKLPKPLSDRAYFRHNPGIDVRVRRPLPGETYPLVPALGPDWIIVVERWADGIRSRRFIGPADIDPPWAQFIVVRLASGTEILINVETLTWSTDPWNPQRRPEDAWMIVANRR